MSGMIVMCVQKLKYTATLHAILGDVVFVLEQGSAKFSGLRGKPSSIDACWK